jgi:hypothetical protein
MSPTLLEMLGENLFFFLNFTCEKVAGAFLRIGPHHERRAVIEEGALYPRGTGPSIKDSSSKMDELCRNVAPAVNRQSTRRYSTSPFDLIRATHGDAGSDWPPRIR